MEESWNPRKQITKKGTFEEKKVDFSAITSFRQSPSKGVVVHAKTEIKAVEIKYLQGTSLKDLHKKMLLYILFRQKKLFGIYCEQRFQL